MKLSNNYTCYKNGKFTTLPFFLIELIKFWRWRRFSKRWMLFSFRQLLTLNFRKFKYPKMEFDYFMNKFSKRYEWFKEYKYKQ